MNWLPGIFRRKALYGDLAEEMRLHLEEKTEQFVAEGMSRKEAEQAARRAFGNATVLEERSREVWHLPLVESLGTDLKLVFRRLRKSPERWRSRRSKPAGSPPARPTGSA